MEISRKERRMLRRIRSNMLALGFPIGEVNDTELMEGISALFDVQRQACRLMPTACEAAEAFRLAIKPIAHLIRETP